MKKTIIIAAGMGKRLRPLTNNSPKCLLKVGKKSILSNQIQIFKSLGIKNINIIYGYKKNKFNKKIANFFFNKNYKKNNILGSLFSAKKILYGDCLISYSDIIYKKLVIKKLLSSKEDISIVTDTAWRKAYKGRTQHPMSEAEKVTFNNSSFLKSAGKNLNNKKANAEFIGVLKLSPKGCKIFKKYYQIAKNKFFRKKFYNADNITKAYIMDFLNFLVHNKIKIKCVKINGSWMEIDTVEDFNKAQKFYK